MNYLNRKLLIVLVPVALLSAMVAALFFSRNNNASATAIASARSMAGLARASTAIAGLPAVLAAFPADMAPAPGSAHLLVTRGDVSVYAWPHGSDGVCVAHSGGGGGCFSSFVTPVNATMSDPDRLGAGHPLYVWGVTTDSVTSVDVIVSGVPHAAPVTNNAFAYVLQDPTLGPEAVSGLVAHFADGTTQQLPAP